MGVEKEKEVCIKGICSVFLVVKDCEADVLMNRSEKDSCGDPKFIKKKKFFLVFL